MGFRPPFSRHLNVCIPCALATASNSTLISFYNKVAQDWLKDESFIRMQLPSPYSTVTSQQQVDRDNGTVKRMLEVQQKPARCGG